jgi:SAM-dependent methyltransferase
VFQLWASEMSNPAHFRIGKPASLDAELTDPQNWNEYWGMKVRTDSVLYEVIAATYRKRIIAPNIKRALQHHLAAGSRLLHAGCGSGQVDIGLHRHFRITALDISVNALTLYYRNNPGAERLLHGSILKIPCEENSFDGVYNMGVLEHFTAQEIEQILGEFRRVLKPGGKIVVFWPHRRATSVMVLRAVHWFLNRILKRKVQLHPAEISLMSSNRQAQIVVERSGLRLLSYSFGPRDGFVQAVIVAQKPIAASEAA